MFLIFYCYIKTVIKVFKVEAIFIEEDRFGLPNEAF